MIEKVKKFSRNDTVGLFCKIAICILIVALIGGLLFQTGKGRYWNDEIFGFQNAFSEDEIKQVDLSEEVRQYFFSQASTLTSIKLYLGGIISSDAQLQIEILSPDGTVCFSQTSLAGEYQQNAWNVIPVDLTGLKSNQEYCLRVACDESGAAFAVLNENTENLEQMLECIVAGQSTSAHLAMGITQVNRVSASDAWMLALTDTAFFCSLSFIFCCAVFHWKQGIAALKQNGWKKSAAYAFVWSLNFVFLFQPLNTLYTQVQDFKRVFGQGTMADIDVGRIIHNFSLWIALFVISFFAACVTWAYLRTKPCQQEQKYAWHFLDQLIVLASVVSTLRALAVFQNGTDILNYTGGLTLLILITGCLYLFTNLWKNVSFERFKSVCFIAFCIAFPAAFLIGSRDLTASFLLGLQFAFTFLACILLCFAAPIQSFLRKSQIWPWTLTLSAAAALAALSVYIEIVNILFGREIKLSNYNVGYLVSLAVIFTLVALVAFWVQKKRGNLPHVKRFAYPLAVVGVAALSQMIPLTAVYTTDLFESANAGILISGFLNFGQIPLVEHYGGHMMGGVWEGILYGILNADSTGAVVSPYGGATLPPYTGMIVCVIALAFYYMLKYVWQEDAAFWTTLIFPFLGFWNYYGLGFVIVVPAVWFLKHQTYRNAALIWIACLFVTLYRLDLGFAFDIACAVALAACLVKERNKKAVKPLLVTLVVTLGLCGSLWVGLCLWKGIPPISRLVEFLQIGLSNLNWAYDNTGNPELLLFAWCYLLVPFFIAATLLYLFISKSFRQKVDQVRWVVLVVSGCSYFVNFSRGLVRHNLYESLSNSQSIVLWCAYFYIALFISCFFQRKILMPILTVFLVLHTAMIDGNAFGQVSLAEQAAGKLSMPFEGWAKAEQQYYAGEPVERVQMSDDFMSFIDPLEKVVDLLLQEDETYVDFVNRTISYTFLKKRNPVYVSQSPLQLSGEFTQECFVEQISKEPDKNPIAIMPYSSDTFFALDGLSNTYRYYKVAEYLYQNYTPLCHNQEYAVWCLNTRYDEMKAKLPQLTQRQSDFSDVKAQGNDLNVTFNDGSLVLQATGDDPFVTNVETWADFAPYAGQDIQITISYHSDQDGSLQIYHAQGDEAIYSEEASLTAPISKGAGKAAFQVPIGRQTHLRLDIPQNSKLEIDSLEIRSAIEPISYGYDWINPLSLPNGSKENYLHYYSLGHLARIWAERDSEKAAENPIIMQLTKQDNMFKLGRLSNEQKVQGNYLLLHVTYAGEDGVGYTKRDDEEIPMLVRVGTMKRETFVERYAYEITVKEGSHDYAIRVSNDYYWYTGEIDTIQLDCDAGVTGLQASILQGD